MPVPAGANDNVLYLNSKAQNMTAPLVEDPYEQETIGDELASMRAKRAALERQTYEEDAQEEQENTNEVAANDNTFLENTPANDNTLEQEERMAVNIMQSKQRSLKKIQPMIKEAEDKLKELENDLTNFRGSKLAGALSIFSPGINLLTDKLLDLMKKPLNNMSDEQKVFQLTVMIVTITALITALQGIRILAAFIDAAFTDKFSCLRMVITTAATIIIPIIIIILSPLTIPFLAILFIVGMIPLVKGLLTNNVIQLIDKLKSQKEGWQKELDKAKKKVALRKQIKALKNMEASIIAGQTPRNIPNKLAA